MVSRVVDIAEFCRGTDGPPAVRPFLPATSFHQYLRPLSTHTLTTIDRSCKSWCCREQNLKRGFIASWNASRRWAKCSRTRRPPVFRNTMTRLGTRLLLLLIHSLNRRLAPILERLNILSRANQNLSTYQALSGLLF